MIFLGTEKVSVIFTLSNAYDFLNCFFCSVISFCADHAVFDQIKTVGFSTNGTFFSLMWLYDF